MTASGYELPQLTISFDEPVIVNNCKEPLPGLVLTNIDQRSEMSSSYRAESQNRESETPNSARAEREIVAGVSRLLAVVGSHGPEVCSDYRNSVENQLGFGRMFQMLKEYQSGKASADQAHGKKIRLQPK